MSARLRELVLDVPDFPRAGVMFKDISGLLADDAALREAVDAMAAPWHGEHVHLIAGIESRGFILGGAVALALGAGFVPIRKQGKLPRQTVTAAYELEYGAAVLEVHADAAVSGQRVLLVDDVLATGGTAAAAASLVHRLGATLVGASFLIELTALGGAAALHGLRCDAVLRY